MPKVATLLVWMSPLLMLGTGEPAATNAPYQGDGFTLQLPNDVRPAKRTPVEDFDLYTFTKKGKVILRMYVGNQPDTKSEEFLEKGRGKKGQEKGYAIRSITKKTIGGSVSREVLFDLSFRQEGWPRYFHFWYADASASAAITADEIIASVEPSVANADAKSQAGKKDNK
jgi:hypothetical protein